MIDKKELLEKYYSEHPEWEQRRYEVLKDLVAANYCSSAITGAIYHKKSNYQGSIGNPEIIKGKVDKILASLNPEIADFLCPFTFIVEFKESPEVIKRKLYQMIQVVSYQNPPKIEEIINRYNSADSSLRLEPSNFNLDDFEITEVE